MAKFYYNGILLPEVPVVSGKPYYWIRKNDSTSYYDLLISPNKWYHTGSELDLLSCEYLRYRTPLSNPEEWEYFQTYNDTGLFTVNSTLSIVFSNHDIAEGSATSTNIYFYASEPVPEYIQKYLIKTDDKLYTVIDGALSELATTDIVSQTFLDYGLEDIPDGALLVGLSNPEVLYWQDSEDDLPTLTATVTATPPPQTVISSRCDLSDATITGIEKMLATCEGELICAVSFDDKATWKAHNGTEWITLSDEYAGMSKETLEAITLEQWNELYIGASGMYIRITLIDTTQVLTKIEVDFCN